MLKSKSQGHMALATHWVAAYIKSDNLETQFNELCCCYKQSFNYDKSAVVRFNVLVGQYRNLNRLNHLMVFEWFNGSVCIKWPTQHVPPTNQHDTEIACDKGMKGSPCDLKTQSCCQHHPTTCDLLLLLFF